MKTGVWLDKKEAIIVSLNQEEVRINTVLSNIEFFHVHGGSGTRLKGGPQDVVQDSTYLEREKHQTKRYFRAIISEIKNANAIVIFGPAAMGKKLHKKIVQDHPYLKDKIIEVVKTDRMTINQVIAWVQTFFKNN